MLPAPYSVSRKQSRDAASLLPIPIEALSSLLANSSPTDQRMVGIYRHIHKYYIYSTYSSKIQFVVVLAIC